MQFGKKPSQSCARRCRTAIITAKPACLAVFICVSACDQKSGGARVPVVVDDWFQDGREAVAQRIELKPRTQRARNTILFIGDGMGISTLTASRIYAGQLRGENGEENWLSFERFPYVALIKTYNANQQVADSAASASAMHTGVKTRAAVLGVTQRVQRTNCSDALSESVATIIEIAEDSGMSTGIVSNMRVTDATPAAAYAHSADRSWERDSAMPAAAARLGCRDIASQLITLPHGDGLDVVFGGGRNNFLGSSVGGLRGVSDANLVEQWLNGGTARYYIETADELADLDTRRTKQVLGLFSKDKMKFVLDRADADSEPTLSEMTAAAIDVLAARPGGYYLLVEGGLIDKGHHQGIAEYALAETRAISNAVTTALEKVDLDETLILVTADHSNVLTIGGYPTRGNPILGLVRKNNRYGEAESSIALALDGQPYTTLGYSNGPGAVSGSRPAPAVSPLAMQQSAVPTIDSVGDDEALETHAGEDVALFAVGPRAYLVGGVMEQNSVFHVIVSAFGWAYDERIQIQDPGL